MGQAHDLLEVVFAAEGAEHNHTQDRGESIATARFSTEVFDLVEAFPEACHLFHFEADRMGVVVGIEGLTVCLGQGPWRAQQLQSISPQGFDPDLLGALMAFIEIFPLSTISRAQAQRSPPARLVASASVDLWVHESFRYQGAIGKGLLPVIGQDSQAHRQRLGGQIGQLEPGQNEKTPVLHHQFQARMPSRPIPADPAVSILQPLASRSPQQKTHPLPVDQSHIAQGLSRAPRTVQIMMLDQKIIESLLLFGQDQTQS